MKLAEALLIRADMQKKLASLKLRIEKNIQVQEGEKPDEDPQELMQQAQQINTELHQLISQIQQTNATAKLDDTQSMLAVLIERDTLQNVIKSSCQH